MSENGSRSVRSAFCPRSARSQSIEYHTFSRDVRKHGSSYQYHRTQRSVSAHQNFNYLATEWNADHPKFLEERERRLYCKMRQIEYTNMGRLLSKKEIRLPENSMKVTVLSYNVLAQELLDQHIYLYRRMKQEVLEWEGRAQRLLREFREAKADVLCLQEVQSDHYETFYLPKLRRMGFCGIFKKRTGDKPDGCAIFYNTSKFHLKESISVEYCKPDVQILDRDNIGLIALLVPRHLAQTDSPPFLCVATTHLLYNPRRHDIKLAQLQLLFAELDRIAFNGGSEAGSYHPVILTGDFNLSPSTGTYQFITGGTLQYEGLSKDLMAKVSPAAGLKKELIPPHLKVTDQCQHLHVIETRIKFKAGSTSKSSEVESEEKHHVPFSFSSGQLSHKLKLQSAYPHWLGRLNGEPEVTTHQKDWITVDYIFYSQSDCENPSLNLLSRLGLLSGAEVESLGGLPNLATPSDHLPLVSTFAWKFQPSSQLE